MRTLASAVLIATGVASAATWHEFDGSVTPDRSNPAWRNPWQKFAVSRAAEGFYTLTIPEEKGGRMWFMRGPAWQPERDLTVEFRVHVVDGDPALGRGSARFVIANGKRTWVCFVQNGDGHDVLRVRTPNVNRDPVVEVPDDFFTVRICVRHAQAGGIASVFVNDEAVAHDWRGFGARAGDVHLSFGDGSTDEHEWGTTVWDYVRWTTDGFFPPAAPAKEQVTKQLPKVVVPMADMAPVIDGSLSDSCWQPAPVLQLTKWRKSAQPAEPTQAKVCTDGKKLFVAFICAESKPDEMTRKKVGRDHEVWGTDLVELFLDPNLDRKSYYQIEVNADGCIWDSFGKSTAWNGDIEAAARVGQASWTCELGIAMDSLDRTPVTGLWGINFNRAQMRTGILYSWAPVEQGHHEPQNFGYASIAGRDTVSDLTAPLTRATTILGELEGNLKLAGLREFHSEKLDSFRATTDALLTQARALGSKPSPDKLVYLHSESENLLRQLEFFRSEVDHVRGETLRKRLVAGQQFVLIPMHSLQKVTQAFVPPHPVPDAVEIQACRGEYESFQAVILNGEQAMRTGRVRCSNLVCGDSTIGALENLDVWSVEYVRIDTPTKYVDHVAPGTLIPDPLVRCDTFNVAPNDLHTLWLTAYVPRDAPAGTYTGHLTVSAVSGPQKSVAVRLHVWDFERPARPSLKTSFSVWDKKGIDVMHGVEIGTPEHDRLHEIYRNRLLQYHLTPREFPRTGLLDFERYDRWLEERIARGETTYIARGPKDVPPSEWAGEFQDHMRDKGWLDRTYVYLWDEPNSDDYPKLRERARVWEEAAPDLKRLVTEPPTRDLDGAVDIWVPLTSEYDRAAADERRRRGEEVWWYVCCAPTPPYANFFTDQRAIEHRILFWQTFHFAAEGLLYWNTTNWRYGDPWRNPATWRSANGDGHLFYPGTDGPLPSIRLEIIRDGMEDYDYLVMLRDLTTKAETAGASAGLIKQAKAALDIASFAGDLVGFTRDPDIVLERRRTIADLIEKLAKTLR